MGTKFLKEGEDFSFPESFGFKGSVNPRNHPTRDEDEFGDGTYLAQQAQEPTYARGGSVHGTVPVHKAATAVLGALQVGKQIGQKMASAGAGMPGQAPTITQGPIPASMMMGQAPAPGGAPAMATGGAVECRADGGKVDTVTPTPRPAHGNEGMGPIESDNYRTLKASPRGWSDDESRYLATNPVGRLTDGEDPEAGHAKGGWIKDAVKKPGELHRDLSVPQGQKIPEAKLEAAAKKSGKVGQRARFAETLRGLNKEK